MNTTLKKILKGVLLFIPAWLTAFLYIIPAIVCVEIVLIMIEPQSSHWIWFKELRSILPKCSRTLFEWVYAATWVLAAALLLSPAFIVRWFKKKEDRSVWISGSSDSTYDFTSDISNPANPLSPLNPMNPLNPFD